MTDLVNYFFKYRNTDLYSRDEFDSELNGRGGGRQRNFLIIRKYANQK